MNLLLFLLIGLLVGLVAEKASKASMGLRASLAAGAIGAFLGGFLVPLLGLEATGLAGSIILAAGSAALLVLLTRRFRHRTSPA